MKKTKEKKCNDCGEKILRGYTMVSLEKEDWGTEFYVCSECIKHYKKDEKHETN